MPADASIAHAIARVDLPWLVARIERPGDPIELLRALLAGEARLRRIALAQLASRALERGSRAELEALAGLLPAEIEGPEETQRLLAEVYQALVDVDTVEVAATDTLIAERGAAARDLPRGLHPRRRRDRDDRLHVPPRAARGDIERDRR